MILDVIVNSFVGEVKEKFVKFETNLRDCCVFFCVSCHIYYSGEDSTKSLVAKR